jgi:hypothetical protein
MYASIFEAFTHIDLPRMCAMERPARIARADELLTTQDAAEFLGLSVAQFNRIVTKLGREPDDTYTNPHYRTGPPGKLWSVRRLRTLKRLKLVQKALERTGGSGPKDYASLFLRRYLSPADAVPDACEAMFQLNRYAKHAKCSRNHRDQIYSLKSELLAMLTGSGHLTAIGQHIVRQPARRLDCFGCYGGGCERCDFTGIYREYPERDLVYVVLRFGIKDKAYTWHQPADNVSWELPPAPRLIDDGLWKEGSIKPVDLKPQKFAEAKALVRFVCDGWRAQRSAAQGGERGPGDGTE